MSSFILAGVGTVIVLLDAQTVINGAFSDVSEMIEGNDPGAGSYYNGTPNGWSSDGVAFGEIPPSYDGDFRRYPESHEVLG
ncbi:MAG: hypothetical protein ACK5NG_04645 [Chthoniobacterales bacterium]